MTHSSMWKILKNQLKKNPQTNIDYSNVAKYKVNTQKSTTFLYTNNEQVKFKIKNIIPFTLAPPKMKYLGINLTKYVWDLYEENHKKKRKKKRQELNKRGIK